MATKYECDLCKKQFTFPEALAKLTVPRTYKSNGRAGFDGKNHLASTTFDVCAECGWSVGDVVNDIREEAKAPTS